MLFSKWSLLTLFVVSGGLFSGKVNGTLTESQEARLRVKLQVDAQLVADAKKAMTAAALYYDTPCGNSRLCGSYSSDSERSTSPSTSPQDCNSLTMSQVWPFPK